MFVYGLSNMSSVEAVLDVFFISVLFLMLKGQSAKCVEGPIRIIVQNFRHFEEGGHSCCAKFFLVSLIRSIYLIIRVVVYWL